MLQEFKSANEFNFLYFLKMFTILKKFMYFSKTIIEFYKCSQISKMSVLFKDIFSWIWNMFIKLNLFMDFKKLEFEYVDTRAVRVIHPCRLVERWSEWSNYVDTREKKPPLASQGQRPSQVGWVSRRALIGGCRSLPNHLITPITVWTPCQGLLEPH